MGHGEEENGARARDGSEKSWRERGGKEREKNLFVYTKKKGRE